jgi:Uma2 family endonuclease
MATTTLMSFAEFECLDAGTDQVELRNGELIRMPVPELRHNEIGETTRDLLKAAVAALGQVRPDLSLGKVHHEMGYKLNEEPGIWLRPDVSLTHPNQAYEKFYIGAPMIALEVVSDSERAARLEEKLTLYFAHGAIEVWLLYPNQRHAWVFTKDGGGHPAKSFRSELLPGVEIPFEKIFV